MVSRSDLSFLEGAGLIHLVAGQPDVEYLFSHVLIQDMAYSTLLKAERRTLHRSVGQVLERLYAGRLDELAAVLAYHFTQAREREKAGLYARRAARQATMRHAYEVAAQLLEAALALCDPSEPDALHVGLLEELGDAEQLRQHAPRALALYQEALALARALPGSGQATTLRLHRKIVQMVADLRWAVDVENFEAARQIRDASRTALEASLQAPAAAGPQPESVRLLVALSSDSWRNVVPADWDQAQRFAESAVDLAEALDDPAELSQALGALATVFDSRGQLRRHRAVALRRVEVSAALGPEATRERLDALQRAGLALLYVGEFTPALKYLEQAFELARTIQAVNLQFNALGAQARCYFNLDRWDEVLAVEDAWRDLEQRYSHERVGLT